LVGSEMCILDRLDTVHMALVSYSSALSASKRVELARYLEARLQLGNVDIIDIGSKSKSSQNGHKNTKK
ncbi:MAG: hypothetical protein K2J52_01015, partial [Duncaniella sp.]|nr:hypothetical protein [Duncaniella sp.]